MGDLTEARLATVRKLLEQAPDSAVESLRGLVSGDGLPQDAMASIAELIAAEWRERRVRNAALAPLAPLFVPPAETPRLTFPGQTPAQLWRGVKRTAPELVAEIMSAVSPTGEAPDAPALYDDICREAADRLRARDDADFAALAARLEAQPGAVDRLIALLQLAPVLRGPAARLASWINHPSDETEAALRVAFKTASDLFDDGGFLFMEALFARLEQPGHILALVSAVMDHPTDRYAASSELASFGERLLDSIDAQLERVRRFDSRRGLEAGVATASAAATAAFRLGEFERHIVLAKDGVWGARVAGQRRTLALGMEMRLREIEPAVSTALPAQVIRSGQKRLRGAAIVTAPPDPAAVDRAMSLLGLLNGCRGSAASGGFGALRAKVAESTDAMLEGYSLELLEALHRQGTGPNGRNIRAFLDVAAEFISLVRDPQSAEFIRRRVATA